MALTIIWSDFADARLDDIYKYYERKVSAEFATKLVRDIIEAPKKLIDMPSLGQEEALLKDREIRYRYFVFKSYKLIYSVDEENSFIKIADVFDTRQDPMKMKRTGEA